MEPQPSSSSSSSSPPTSPTLDQSKPRSSTITHHSNTSNSSIFQRVASRSLRHKQKHRPPAQRELPPVPVPGPSTSSPPAFASPIPSSDPAQPSSSSAASFTTSPSAAESGHHGRRSRESSASSALSLDNGSASTGASLSSSQVSSRSVGVPRPAGEIGHPSSMDAAVASPSGGVTSGSNRGPPSSWMNRNRDRSGSVGSPRKRPSTSTGASSATEVESKPLSPRRMSSWRRASASIRAEAPEEDGAHTPLGATSRTPRSSMYGLFAGVGSESRLASASSQSPRPESAAKRLFGRSNSSRECVGSAATSSEATEEHGSEAADRKSLLRRVGSRPLLSGERDKDRGDSDGRTISTDTLCSTGATPIGMERSTATPEATMSRRRGGSISKAAGLKGWGRRKRAGASGGVEAGNSDEGKTPPLPSVNQDDKKLDLAGGDDARRTSIDSFASSMGRAAGRNVQTPNAQAQAQRQMAPPSDEGIPRRLSGWLLNMIGSDSPSGPGLAESPSPNSDDGSMRPPVLPQGRLQAHGSGTDSNAKAGLGVLNSGSSSSSLAVAGRSKAASLLSSLSSSARARTFGPEGSGSGSAGSGGGGGGGLDRALRYFLDSDAMNASSSEEGIWLLGVWHGPGASESPRQGPTIEVQQASPNATLSAERHPPAPPRTPSPTDLVASSSPAGSRVQVLARNPPTPHGSPNPHSASGGVTAPMSSSQSAANSSQNWQITFQPDFSSRIWCTYRNHFTPIARDGSISFDAAGAAERAAELAASNASAGMVPGASNKSTGYITPERAPGMVASTHGGSGRHWLGRKTSDAEASANSSPASSTFAPGGLGAALGVSSSPSQSPGAGTSPGGGGGLGEKMGIPSLWGRAASAAAGVAANLGGGGKGLTTDAGWGCMLRTGQSLLANALIVTHLGRDWRRGPLPASPGSVRRGSSHSSQAGMDKVPQEEEDLEEPSEEEQRALKEEWLRHATYARILSWFLDDPSPACAFGVHRMAREGKRLGKEVGEWFGPSTAAGAIKELVNGFPDAGLGVALAADGVVYTSEVQLAAAGPLSRFGSTRPHEFSSSMSAGHDESTGTPSQGARWTRPVLILVGIRLGLDGVHPMYHDSVKATFSFPQSVGIAGGRPSSSYYFMGFQGNSLFYLDPHHVRPAVPFRHPPPASSFGTDLSAEKVRQAEDDWYTRAYTEQQLATFHCERVRRMPIRSLDPSMLLGFLCQDEAQLDDLCARVRALPKPIFSFADVLPRWAEDDDFDPAMESFSESSVDAGEDEDDRVNMEAADTDVLSDDGLVDRDGGIDEHGQDAPPSPAETAPGRGSRTRKNANTSATLQKEAGTSSAGNAASVLSPTLPRSQTSDTLLPTSATRPGSRVPSNASTSTEVASLDSGPLAPNAPLLEAGVRKRGAGHTDETFAPNVDVNEVIGDNSSEAGWEELDERPPPAAHLSASAQHPHLSSVHSSTQPQSRRLLADMGAVPGTSVPPEFRQHGRPRANRVPRLDDSDDDF